MSADSLNYFLNFDGLNLLLCQVPFQGAFKIHLSQKTFSILNWFDPTYYCT